MVCLFLNRRIQFNKIKIPKNTAKIPLRQHISVFLLPFCTSKDEGSAFVISFKLRSTWCNYKWLSSLSWAEINPLNSRAAINVLLFAVPTWISLLGHCHFLPSVGIGSQDHRLSSEAPCAGREWSQFMQSLGHLIEGVGYSQMENNSGERPPMLRGL